MSYLIKMWLLQKSILKVQELERMVDSNIVILTKKGLQKQEQLKKMISLTIHPITILSNIIDRLKMEGSIQTIRRSQERIRLLKELIIWPLKKKALVRMEMFLQSFAQGK